MSFTGLHDTISDLTELKMPGRDSQHLLSGENCFLDVPSFLTRPARASHDFHTEENALPMFPGTYTGLEDFHRTSPAVKTAFSIFLDT